MIANQTKPKQTKPQPPPTENQREAANWSGSSILFQECSVMLGTPFPRSNNNFSSDSSLWELGKDRILAPFRVVFMQKPFSWTVVESSCPWQWWRAVATAIAAGRHEESSQHHFVLGPGSSWVPICECALGACLHMRFGFPSAHALFPPQLDLPGNALTKPARGTSLTRFQTQSSLGDGWLLPS